MTLINFINTLKKYNNETHNTVITCIIYKYSIDNTIKDLYKKLKNIQNIKHPQTKKLLNDRIYNFIQYLTDMKMDELTQLNSIYLINNDINEYKLQKKEINLLIEFNKPNYYIMFDIQFKTDWLLDFFTNFNYYNSFECNKKQVNHILLTKTKSKINKKKTCKTEEELQEFISEYNEFSILHGVSTFLKKLICKIPVYNKKLTNNEIIDILEKEEMKKKHKELNDIFNYLDDERKLHLLIYGRIKNEIKQAMEEYRVKKLYCHIDKLHIVKKQLSSEYYNFPIIIIKTLESGDIADKLLNDFKGAIAISYY